MRLQTILAGVALLGLVGCEAASCDETMELRRYERWVQELRAKDALSRSLLEQRTEHYEHTVQQYEARSGILHAMVMALKADAGDLSADELQTRLDSLASSIGNAPDSP